MEEPSLSTALTQPADAKSAMRRAAYDARAAQPEKEAASAAAATALMQLAEYQRANTVLWYLDCRSELRTRHALPEALTSGKKIVVPYCTVDDFGANKLGLWWLQSMDELVVGKWKILEPPRERWGKRAKKYRRKSSTSSSCRESPSAAAADGWETARDTMTGCCSGSAPTVR